jgi:hypothetical protein
MRRYPAARRGRRDGGALQCGHRSSHGGAEQVPIADSVGDTSWLGRTRRRSVEEMELECARDLRLLTSVNARECSEDELEKGS